MQKKKIIGIVFILIILVAGGSYFIINSKDKNINNNEVIENNINDSKLNENQDNSQDNTQNIIQEEDEKTKEYLESKEKELKENKNGENASQEKNAKNEKEYDNKHLQNDLKDKTNNKFSFDKALEICKNKYGDEPDTVYTGNDNIQNLNGKSGYIIQVKSKEMMKQGGTGVLFSVLVTSNGEIVEIE